MFGLVPLVALRPIEREGAIVEPGGEFEAPFEEARHMLAAGFAAPKGADLRPPPRPQVGRFVWKRPR